MTSDRSDDGPRGFTPGGNLRAPRDTGPAQYVRGSDTGRASPAFQDATGTRSADARRVLRVMDERVDHGTIDDELERLLGLEHQAASARRGGPEKARCVRRTDRRRLTCRERPAHASVITPVGLAELEARERAVAEGGPWRRELEEAAADA